MQKKEETITYQILYDRLVELCRQKIPFAKIAEILQEEFDIHTHDEEIEEWFTSLDKQNNKETISLF